MGIIDSLINFGSQERTNQMQMALQNISWAREDTAVGRSAADFEAAGLSKTLAAGSRAQTMSPIKLNAPKVGDLGVMQASQVAMGALKTQADIRRTKAEIGYINQQKNTSQANELLLRETTPGRKNELELRNVYHTVADPMRIQVLVNDVKKGTLVVSEKELDVKLKKLGVSQAELNIVARGLENDLLRHKLPIVQKELLIKTVAYDAAVQAMRIKQYDWEASYASGMRTTDRSGAMLPIHTWARLFTQIFDRGGR